MLLKIEAIPFNVPLPFGIVPGEKVAADLV
jgi:hypothetical protein